MQRRRRSRLAKSYRLPVIISLIVSLLLLQALILWQAFGVSESFYLSNTLPLPHSPPSMLRIRYTDLLTGKFSRDRIMIAMNLHQNADVLPHIMTELMALIEFLGADRVFVSIYESGSTDRTPSYLRQLSTNLRLSGVPNRIIFDENDDGGGNYAAGDVMIKRSSNATIFGDGAERREWRLRGPRKRHRIEFLAWARNRAIEPLLALAESDQMGNGTENSSYSRLLFINDVLFTAEQMLELLEQSLRNNASITCGLDFNYSILRGLGFYDTWVAQDMEGHQFNYRPLTRIVGHAPSNDRYLRNQPFQVQCCWNGAAVLDTRPFRSPHNVRFRRELSRLVDGSEPPQSVVKIRNIMNNIGHRPMLYKSCSASEISTLCNDFQRSGFQRAMVVPSVKLAYNWNVYREMWRYFEGNLGVATSAPHIFNNTSEADNQQRQSVLVDFKSPPTSVDCWPLERVGIIEPDGPIGRLIV